MKQFLSFVLLLNMCVPLVAQNSMTRADREIDSWTVTVNEMNPVRREMINRTIENLQERGGATRSVVATMLLDAATSVVPSLVDITATEIVRLVNLRSTQKKEWAQMIEKECKYTDSISSVRGLKDFYTETSRLGALDPSNMNFDGISVRGVRDGHEVLFLSCHIDESRLAHLYQHSKFCLIVDTIAFYPYECHLPNLRANGIVLSPSETTERDNKFSYDEREQLTIGMELSLSSSWINEAITIQKDVELGNFKMSVTIPYGTEVYTYSRAAIDQNRKMVSEGKAPKDVQLDTTYVNLSGDCFVVPRSYMPINGNDSMWGTGEYSMKVKFSESCRFSQDPTRNMKMKNWKQDYQQLRKMQRHDNAFTEYFRTLWRQNGNTLMKTMVKTGLSTAVNETGINSKKNNPR